MKVHFLWGNFPRTFRRTLLVLAATGLLAGCIPFNGGLPNVPPATNAEVPSTAGIPSTDQPSSPPPTSSSTDQPSQTEWLISSAGIGPYKLHQPYDFPDSGTSNWKCSLANLDGIALFDLNNFSWNSDETTPPGLTASMIMTSGEHDPPARTAKGIGFGSTLAELKAAYPDATLESNPIYGDLYKIRDNGVPIIFREKAGTVIAVEVGSEYFPHEFCA
jgi:hypothetical protein